MPKSKGVWLADTEGHHSLHCFFPIVKAAWPWSHLFPTAFVRTILLLLTFRLRHETEVAALIMYKDGCSTWNTCTSWSASGNRYQQCFLYVVRPIFLPAPWGTCSMYLRRMLSNASNSLCTCACIGLILYSLLLKWIELKNKSLRGDTT